MIIDIEPTIKVISHISNTLRNFANDIDSISETIIKTKDLSRTADVLISVANCFTDLRLDLLVTRPFREYKKLTQELYKDLEKAKYG